MEIAVIIGGILWTFACFVFGLVTFLNPKNIAFIARYPRVGQAEKYGFVDSKSLVRFFVTMLILAWTLPFSLGGLRTIFLGKIQN